MQSHAFFVHFTALGNTPDIDPVNAVHCLVAQRFENGMLKMQGDTALLDGLA